MKKRILLLASIIPSLLLTGCSGIFVPGNKSSSSSEIVEEVFDATINYQDSSFSIREGQSGQPVLDINIKSGKSLAPKLVYSSSNEAVATVDDSGFVHALSAGTTNITAQYEGTDIKSSISVSVTTKDRGESAIQINECDTDWYTISQSDYVDGTGDQNVLVIPVYFKDDADKATKENRDFIETSFFGSNDDCGWRSFKGYYDYASYGNLHYSGIVAPEWYKASYTKEEVRKDMTAVEKTVKNALKWFIRENEDVDMSQFDKNNDKCIDSLYIIYASDYERWGESNLWGFRSSISDYTTTSYKARAYSWFSLLFLESVDDYGGVPEDGSNTRVIIHEHGHMLGLPDYYDYGYAFDLVGSWDMQASNVFDWNAYSKYSVGWVDPYYVDEERLRNKGTETFTFYPSAKSGDCLIIPTQSWNGTPFDEFLMVELFNPELGNNNYDYHENFYSGIKETGYGVKIYHVDARMLDWKSSSWQKVNDFKNVSGYAFTLNDNDSAGSDRHNIYKNYYGITGYDDYHFLHLLQKENVSTFDKTGDSRHTWKQSDLWQTGDTFAIGAHAGYTNYGPSFFANGNKFNDGGSLNYGIKFDEVTENKVTITLTYFE